MRTLVLVLLIALSGCVDDTPADHVDTGMAPETGPAGEIVYYTTPEMGLTTEMPDAGSVPLPWTHTEQIRHVAPPTWVADVGGLNVTSARAELTFEVPTAAIGTQFRGGDLTVWWGSTVSTVSHVTPDSDPVFVAGQQYRMAVDLEVPVGGFIIPPGEPPVLMVAGYLATSAAEPLRLVTGEASILRLVATPWNGTVPTWTQQTTWEGTGLDCNQDGATSIAYPFEVSNATRPLRVTIEKTGGAGHPDLDLFLIAPDGNWVARAHGPGGVETVDLWPPQLTQGAGTYTARVVGYCAADITFQITIFE